MTTAEIIQRLRDKRRDVDYHEPETEAEACVRQAWLDAIDFALELIGGEA